MNIPLNATCGQREIEEKGHEKGKTTDLSAYPLFIWKWQFKNYFRLTEHIYGQLFTPDVVTAMGLTSKQWRNRQRIYRRELPALVDRLDVTIEELHIIACLK